MSIVNEINKKLEARAKLVEDARTFLDGFAKENRSPTPDETKQYDKMIADAESIGAEVERMRKLEALERSVLADPAKTQPVGDGEQRKANPERKAEVELELTRHYILNGSFRDVPEGLAREARDLQVSIDTSGGYTRPAEQFLARLLKNIDDMVAIRSRATKFSVVNAESLGVPYMSARASNASWTTELQTGSDDTQLAFGKRALTPHPLAKRIKVSEKLLRSSALPVENIVAAEMAYVFGITEETAFATGSGASQPLGLFTASADGINTDRDVSTGNLATSVTIDGLKEAKWTLKGQYHPKAAWLFHRDALKQVDKLKDGEGRYIWQPSVVAGQPDSLLNFPVLISDYVPNTFTSGLYVGMLGDFSYYWIVDSLNFQLKRLNELYAETGQIGFIGRLECDAAPVLPEAFVRVKLG